MLLSFVYFVFLLIITASNSLYTNPSPYFQQMDFYQMEITMILAKCRLSLEQMLCWQYQLQLAKLVLLKKRCWLSAKSQELRSKCLDATAHNSYCWIVGCLFLCRFHYTNTQQILLAKALLLFLSLRLQSSMVESMLEMVSPSRYSSKPLGLPCRTNFSASS